VAEKPNDDEHLISDYKVLIRSYLAIRPAGLRKKISEAIGTNRSFVTQITNPNYRVPIPSQYIHKIMDVCNLSPVERANFVKAYLEAHPSNVDLLGVQTSSDSETALTIDLSAVEDATTREMIKRSLRNIADILIKVAGRNRNGKRDSKR
jgi:hypothetical protein